MAKLGTYAKKFDTQTVSDAGFVDFSKSLDD